MGKRKPPALDDYKKAVQAHAKDIVREKEHWEYMRDNGCNDPFWSDGCNMNLTRNHIIYAKTVIAKVCSETGLPIPAEYYIPTPPEVDNQYMANLEQKERVDRLRQGGLVPTRKCPAYDSEQLSLF